MDSGISYTVRRGGSFSAGVGMIAAMAYFVALFLVSFAASAAAESLVVGSELAPFSLEDQHGHAHGVGADVRAILFAREMEGGEVVKAALAEFGAELLFDADAVYIADVSGMPKLIRRMFALPKMRKRGYPMLLDTDGTVCADFPGLDGHATLILLASSKIAAIDHYDSAEEVRAALRALRPQPPDEETQSD